MTAENAFPDVIHYIEKDSDDQMTVSNLVDKMKALCGDEAYSAVYMNMTILEHFGDSVVIAELNGKHNSLTFKSTAHAILHTWYDRKGKNGSASESRSIVHTTAKFILNDIKSIETSIEEYPATADIMSIESNMKYVPEALRLLLTYLINNKGSERKIVSIDQAIVQTSIPRKLIAPLRIGFGVQMHHQFGSKFLIEVLHSLGFCSSYQRFERSAATSQGTQINKTDDQFLADNVDYNTGTLDGHNTFDGMGIIAAVMPNIEHTRVIQRISTTSDDLVAVGKINIKFYKQQNNNMENMVFRQLVELADIEGSYE